MTTKNKRALFLENGKKKCWVIVIRFKRPFAPNRNKNEKKIKLFSERTASEKMLGKIIFAIQDELERHQIYEVMIEGETYRFELQKNP